jgi:hypothetical protein
MGSTLNGNFILNVFIMNTVKTDLVLTVFM